MGGWNGALTEVAKIVGADISNRDYKDDVELIQKISQDVLNRLNWKLPNDNPNLKGMDVHMKAIEPLLEVGSKRIDVRVIGLCGMGGIGKTTIAKYICGKFHDQFDLSCLYHVKKDNRHDEASLQRDFLSEVLQVKDMTLPSFAEGSDVLKARLGHKKALIVLDDVDKLSQIQALAGEKNWFGLGSIIIITSRDKGLLLEFAKYEITIHEVECLCKDDAKKLFCQYAFGQESPKHDFSGFLDSAIRYCGRLPLALKVIGSHMRGKDIRSWKIEETKLENFFRENVLDLLEISYDGLREKEKDIFLYIACFFREEKIEWWMRILSPRYPSVEHSLRVLVNKSLVDVSDGYVRMHDLLREIGMQHNRQQSNEHHGDHKLLSDPTEIYDVITDFTGTRAVEAIFLVGDALKNDLIFTDDAFKSMPNLSFLIISVDSPKLSIRISSDRLNYLPRKLVHLEWDCCPLRMMPFRFRPECLGEIIMRYGELESLWNGTQQLPNLRRLNLDDSRKLKTISGLSAAPNLEELTATSCHCLIDVSSIQTLQKLAFVNLGRCGELKCLRSFRNMDSLKSLALGGCFSLKSFPEVSPNIERIVLQNVAIEEVLPSLIRDLASLVDLNLRASSIRSIPREFGNLSGLKTLDFSWCRELRDIPETIQNLSSVETLDLRYCKQLRGIPETIKNMKSLKYLRLRGCRLIRSLPELPRSLKLLIAWECSSLEEINLLSMPRRLQLLSLTNCVRLASNQYLQQIGSHLLGDEEITCLACLPGSHTPEYFSSQTKGYSIRIPLPQSRLLVGFLGSAVLPHASDGSLVDCRCYITRRDGTKDFIYPNWTRIFFPDTYYGRFDADHLYLISYFFKEPKECNGMALTFAPLDCCPEVKECGIRPIFVEDLGKGVRNRFAASSSSSLCLMDDSEVELFGERIAANLEGKESGRSDHKIKRVKQVFDLVKRHFS